MANAAPTNSGANQEVGTVFILYGTVKAVSPEGFERILKPNSPIFANERIMTGPDGRISVAFIDGETQLDLGRMSDVLIDSDVYAALTPEESIDAAAQVGDIQQALEDESFDPTQELEDPAAGDTVAGEGGGGHPYVVFEANQMEVTPDSGAETTGISTSFLEPPPVDIVEEEEETGELTPDDASPPPAAPPDDSRTVNQPQDLKPIAVDDKNEVVEGFQVITGNVYDNDTDGTPATSLTSVTIDGVEIEIPANGSVTRLTDLGGELTINSDGTYSYTILTNILHEANGQGDGLDDFETFSYTITDANGDTSTATLTINIIDTAPLAHPDGNIVTEGRVETVGDGQEPTGNQVEGNVIFGWDDGVYIAASADEQSADQGLHLVNVTGDLADGVVFAFDTELATSQGGTIVFSSNGSYIYTAPSAVDNPLDGEGNNLAVPEQFQYTVEDADGSPSSAVLTINIEDTAPSANADVATVEVGDRTPGDGLNNQVSGNVILADQNRPGEGGSGPVADVADIDGADGGTHLLSVSGDFASNVVFAMDTELATAQGGTIIFSSDGSYTYTAPDSIDHSDASADVEQFTYTIADSDGSEANANLTINLVDGFGGSVDSGVVAESALDQGGTDPTSNAENWLNGQIVVESDGEGFVLNVGGTDVVEDGTQIQGAHGTLTVDLDGSWSYVLESSTDAHSRAGATGADDVVQGESFAVTVSSQGSAGSQSIGDLTIDILDDGPVFGETQDAILVNEQGNSVTGDLDLAFGADGPADIASLQLFGPDGQVLNGQPVVNQAGQGLTFNDGEEMVYVSDGRGGVTAVGTQSAVEVFTISLDPLAGTYNVALLGVPLDGAVDEQQFSVYLHGPGGVQGSPTRDVFDNGVHVQATGEVDFDGDGQYTPAPVHWNPYSEFGMGVVGTSATAWESEYVNSGERLVLDFFHEGDGEVIALREATLELSGLDEGENVETATWTAINADGEEVGRGTAEGLGRGHQHSADQFITISEADTGGQEFTTIHLYADTGGYKVEGVTGVYGGQDHKLDFDVVATDGDGDQAETEISVTFDGGGIVAGTDESEAIAGAGGNDIITGRGGDDTISGNAGDDVIDGGSGNDTLAGGEGDDTLIGGETGDDIISGEEGDDTISGNDGSDTIAGGTGDDVMEGGAGADSIDGGDGEDTASYAGDNSSGVTVNLQDDQPEAGGDAEGDTLSNVENVVGGSGNDTLVGDESNNRLVGGRGSDDLDGGGGDDNLEGGREDDNLDGGSGNDTLIGGDGSDSFQAQEVADETTDYDENIDALVPPVDP